VSGFGAWAPRQALVLVLVALSGCAGATAERPQLDAAFARIQVHEAEIERARVLVQRSETGCEQACASADSAGREQAALCQLAQRVDDTDALTRCSRAEHTASGLRAQAARRCGCR
jgi:hypothetical protein